MGTMMEISKKKHERPARKLIGRTAVSILGLLALEQTGILSFEGGSAVAGANQTQSSNLLPGVIFAESNGVVFGEPNAAGAYDGNPTDPVVGITAVNVAGQTAKGYDLVASRGGLANVGGAPYEGSAAGINLAAPIVGIASTPDGKGYWEVGADGGVFSFGDASFYGSMGGKHLNAPVVGIASTADGKGYWLAAKDGGVFSFGDARFYGSMAGKQLNQPVDGIISTPDGKGYWLAAKDGGVFSFGDAGFYGSAPGFYEQLGANLPSDYVGIVPMNTANSTGYGVYDIYGDMIYFSSSASPRYIPTPDIAQSGVVGAAVISPNP